MKATADKIALAYAILNGAKLKELSNKEKIAVIKATHKLKEIATSLNDLRDDSYAKLKPEGFEEIEMKVHSQATLTPAELLSYNKVEKALQECMKEESEKEHEIDLKPISEEVLGKLLDSNDFTVGQAQLLMEILG